mmetsp:Transcript_1639/g.1747  ORF Transcript_1639/g.1747 Transcript_1639/m.1747 type:complete len:175 (-) Transcript_1639:88-612(-)
MMSSILLLLMMMMTMMMLPLLIVVFGGSDDNGQGEDVCSAVSGAKDCSRCLDTSAVVAHEGNIYCARDPDATVSTNGLGITYSQRSDDGTSEADTKWWKNIEPCAPNTKGNCHYEDDIDGIFSKADEEEPVTAAVNATEAPAVSAAEPVKKKSTTTLIFLGTAISGAAAVLLLA